MLNNHHSNTGSTSNVITAVSDNKQPAMSKTSLDFGFFCDINKNLKAQRLLSGPLRKQKLTSTGSKGYRLFVTCDWWIWTCFVYFCVSRLLAFELQGSHVFTF